MQKILAQRKTFQKNQALQAVTYKNRTDKPGQMTTGIN